ncbi:MAG: hypothetical protein J6U85_04185 [Bacteroidales bacterium]|nr:hypothetical protein [Bacteroidales bacterium]
MERWPILALFVVVIIITAVVVWLLSRWYHRFVKVEDTIKELPCEKHDDLYHRIVETEEAVKELPCSKHDDLYHRIVETEEVVKELPRLRYDINEIKQELVAIRTYLTVKDTDVENVFSRKHSPRELNEAGEKLYADIKGEEFLDKNKDILIQGIDNRTPKTALDVEESALEVIVSLIDNDMFIGMKNWVYNSSPRKLIVDGVEKDYSISMNDVCFVLSLPLRNMYLDLHPELQEIEI